MIGVKREAMDPKGILTMEDLPVLMTKLTEIAGQWNLLGVQLKFLPGTLKAFPSDIQADPIKAFQELLTRWLQRTAPPPTLESLAEVVRGSVIGNEHLATTLLEGRAELPSAQAREPDHCSSLPDVPPQTQLPQTPKLLKSRDSGYGSQSKHFNCQCGWCTLDTYLSKGCPVASKKRLFPYLNTNVMSDREIQNLEAKLLADANEMVKYFDDFVTQTLRSFKERDVSLPLIQMHVKNLRATLIPPKQKAKTSNVRIPKWKSHEECFSFLADYWSWFNTTILEQLISHDGTREDRGRLTTFQDARKDFLMRKIFEIPPNMYGVKREKNSNELVLKLDDRYSVAKTDGRTVLGVKTFLYNMVSVHAELLSVQNGCLKLTFQIPEVEIQPLSRSKKQLLWERGVISIVVISPSGERIVYQGDPSDVGKSPRRGRKRPASRSPPLDSGDTPSRRCSDPGPYDEPRSKSIKVC